MLRKHGAERVRQSLYVAIVYPNGYATRSRSVALANVMTELPYFCVSPIPFLSLSENKNRTKKL